jgi:hypothetical protein
MFEGASGYTTAWESGGGASDYVIDWTDNGFREDCFYFLRVIQEDGHMGWAGPTWVKRS